MRRNEQRRKGRDMRRMCGTWKIKYVRLIHCGDLFMSFSRCVTRSDTRSITHTRIHTFLFLFPLQVRPQHADSRRFYYLRAHSSFLLDYYQCIDSLCDENFTSVEPNRFVMLYKTNGGTDKGNRKHERREENEEEKK